MSDIIKQLSELLLNAKDFAKHHKVDSIQTYFDFIPDEVLTEIFIYLMDNLELTLVCRRFNDVYISLICANPSLLTLPLIKILDWEDKIESFGILTQRELSLMCYFPNKTKIFKQLENKTIALEYKRKELDCCFYLNDEIYYMKKRCTNLPTDKPGDDNHLQFETITSEFDRYLYSKNNRNDVKNYRFKTYRSKYSVCIVNRNLVTIILGDMVFVGPKKDFDTKQYNGIKYYFPFRGHNCRQINEILLGEHSPYPITVMGNLSIGKSGEVLKHVFSIEELLNEF